MYTYLFFTKLTLQVKNILHSYFRKLYKANFYQVESNFSKKV